MKTMHQTDKIKRVLREAYRDCRHGGVSDSGGTEPLGSDRAALWILDALHQAGFQIVSIPPLTTGKRP